MNTLLEIQRDQAMQNEVLNMPWEWEMWQWWASIALIVVCTIWCLPAFHAFLDWIDELLRKKRGGNAG